MKLGSVPLRPLWPGSMPTVIPASGLAAAVGFGLGAGEDVAGSGERRAAGEATASPAALVPLLAGCWLPHAASRQARAAGQATAGSNRHRPHRARLVPVTVWPLSSAVERVDVLNLPPAALAQGGDREHRSGVSGLAGAGPGVLLVGEHEQAGPVAVEQFHPAVGDLGFDDQFLG